MPAYNEVSDRSTDHPPHYFVGGDTRFLVLYRYIDVYISCEIWALLPADLSLGPIRKILEWLAG